MMLKVLLCLSLYVIAAQCCILLLNGWKPLGIERRAELAEVVVSTRTLSKNKIAGHKWLYAASFEVLSILKGWNTLNRLKRRKSGAVQSNDRLVITVSGFGDRRYCFSSVDVGETYILFLAYNNISDSLVAKYDDIFGAAELLYESSEDEILLSLGWRPWTPWTSCSQQCGDGLRLRQRQCFDKSVCNGPSEEMRECNMFPCQDTHDILKFTRGFQQEAGINHAVINNVHNTIDEARIPSVPTYLVFPDKFPPSFSLFMTVKVSEIKEPEYVFSSFDPNNRMQFGIRLEKGHLSFVYTSPKDMFGEKIVKSFPVTLKVSVWQEIAISLEKTLLRIVVNCHKIGEVRIDWPITEDFDVFGYMYIGADKSEGKSSKFKHEVSQLLITRHPEMLWKQCGTRVFFYPGYLGKSRQQAPAPSVNPIPGLRGDDSESGDVDENLVVSSGDGSFERGESEGSGASSCFPQCQNGGVCKNGVCACLAGWTGVDCTQVKPCPRNCLHNGICNKGKCQCRNGWTGDDCSQAICRQPCQNNGVCTKPNFCRCKNGTTGRYCEKYICKPECRNGGICVGRNLCKCPSQVKGRYCEKDSCASVRCFNGGKCLYGKCACPVGFYGSSCEKRICKVYGTRKTTYLRPVVVADLQQYKYQCGILMLRTCSGKKLIYRMVNKIGYKDEYYCKE